MRISKRLILLLASLLIALFMVWRGYNWSQDHYEYYTTGEVTGRDVSAIHALNCGSCHKYTQRDGFLANLTSNDYISPYNLAISPDNEHLFVTGQESNALYIVGLRNNRKIAEIDVGRRPHSVAVTRDGSKAFVSNQWSDNVSVIDVAGREVVRTIATGGGPAGIALGPEEKFLYVANTYTSNVSVIDLSDDTETRRLRAGNYPTGLELSPDGRFVFVVSQRSVIVEYRDPPKTEMTVIDTGSQRVVERKYFEEAHIMEQVHFTPAGDLALTSVVRPKNLVPAVQVEGGWMMNFALGLVALDSGRMYQLPLDEPNNFYADPYGVRVTPDGSTVFISHSGADYISAADISKLRDVIRRVDDRSLYEPENNMELSQSYVKKRIRTGSNPKGMEISPDGNYLYFAERLTDRIGVINTQSLDLETYIDLDEEYQEDFLRYGEQLFNNARHTFQNQYSCYSCHPDNHEDGLTYDMDYYPGQDLSNVQTLRELANTSPFKWNGQNVSIYMQCGMRFSKFVTRTEVMSPHDLKALVGFITSEIEHPPNLYRSEGDELTPAQQRGKELFERTRTNDGRVIAERDRCINCHPPPNFTDRQLHDVGTATEIDRVTEFLTPHLNNIYESPPYLHDGRANTLEELWTVYNDDDEHGVANDMTKDQLNDLIEYLLSIGSADYYK